MTILIASAVALLAIACSEETEDDGGGAGAVQSCDDLCALAPVDGNTASCVSSRVFALGYDVGDPACSDANTPSGCTACYDAIAVSDADCVAVHDACF
jgi:hypothetical protein